MNFILGLVALIVFQNKLIWVGGSAGVSLFIDFDLERVGGEEALGRVGAWFISSKTVFSFWKSSLSGTRRFPWWRAAAG